MPGIRLRAKITCNATLTILETIYLPLIIIFITTIVALTLP